jgi:hypothetical protein
MTNLVNFKKAFDKAFEKKMSSSVFMQILKEQACPTCGVKGLKHTPEHQKELDLARKEYEEKEEKRRAEVITMTVGELEDKLQEASSDY